GSPGTIALEVPPFSSAVAPSKVSSRSPPALSRISSSGPWQAKQRSDRIGRIWLLKSTGSAGSAPSVAANDDKPTNNVTIGDVFRNFQTIAIPRHRVHEEQTPGGPKARLGLAGTAELYHNMRRKFATTAIRDGDAMHRRIH